MKIRKEDRGKILHHINNINKCKLFINVMSFWNINNNQLILEGLIRAMLQLTERNQLMYFIIYIYRRFGFPLSYPQCMKVHSTFDVQMGLR